MWFWSFSCWHLLEYLSWTSTAIYSLNAISNLIQNSFFLFNTEINICFWSIWFCVSRKYVCYRTRCFMFEVAAWRSPQLRLLSCEMVSFFLWWRVTTTAFHTQLVPHCNGGRCPAALWPCSISWRMALSTQVFRPGSSQPGPLFSHVDAWDPFRPTFPVWFQFLDLFGEHFCHHPRGMQECYPKDGGSVWNRDNSPHFSWVQPFPGWGVPLLPSFINTHCTCSVWLRWTSTDLQQNLGIIVRNVQGRMPHLHAQCWITQQKLHHSNTRPINEFVVWHFTISGWLFTKKFQFFVRCSQKCFDGITRLFPQYISLSLPIYLNTFSSGRNWVVTNIKTGINNIFGFRRIEMLIVNHQIRNQAKKLCSQSSHLQTAYMT